MVLKEPFLRYPASILYKGYRARPLIANRCDFILVKKLWSAKQDMAIPSHPRGLMDLGNWVHFSMGKLDMCTDYSVLRILTPVLCE
jgi:hypothetical protein